MTFSAAFDESWGTKFHFCVPAGIGDVSWIYSKLVSLKRMTGYTIELSVSGLDKPQRGHSLIELLPDVKWAGYVDDRDSWVVHSQSLPAEWPAQIGIGFMHKPYMQNLSANVHLEMGRPLSQWLPFLPTEYHYKLNISDIHKNHANNIISRLRRPIFAVYVSNRDKDQQKRGGWNLWNEEQWINFLRNVMELPECRMGSLLFLGADYDRDRTEAVSSNMKALGFQTHNVINQPLGVALSCLEQCHYCFSYPSGIGILANVLHVPCLMLLPWLLKNLENTYADPLTIENKTYRAWADPKPHEAFDWFRRIGMVQSFDWL